MLLYFLNLPFAHISFSFVLEQISFLYVDLIDTTGTLVAMSKQAGLFDQRDGDFEGSSVAFLVDSACISLSGLFFGTSRECFSFFNLRIHVKMHLD